jgi:hypothetical protein
MTMFGRVKTVRMTIEVINLATAEILKLDTTPEELPNVMRVYNILNPDGQYKVDRIYAYGDVEDLQKTRKITMEYLPVEERE